MNKNKLNVKSFIIGILFLAPISLLAQSNKGGERERPSMEQMFSEMDKNEDGKLSESEVKGPLKNDFSKIDLDEDGFITKEELEKAPKPNRKDKNKRKPRK